MKRIYERPVMMAEVYETNAYCNACGSVVKNGTMYLSWGADGCAFYRNNSQSTWQPGSAGGVSFTIDNLTHTFSGEGIESDGQCRYSCREDTQAYWPCDCHTGNEQYYLEWSHNYSVHTNNGKDTFFLYKESGDRSGFQLSLGTGPWPQKASNNSDICVAQVVYGEGYDMVVDS